MIIIKRNLKKIITVIFAVVFILGVGFCATENKVSANGDSEDIIQGIWKATFYNPVKYEVTDAMNAIFYADFTGGVAMEYLGNKSGDYVLTIFDHEYNLLLDENGNPYALDKPITNTTVFDYSVIKESEFIARYQKHTYGTSFLPDTWVIIFNNEKISVSTVVNKPINPTEIINVMDDDRPNAVISWKIRDSNDNIVLTGTGTSVSQEELEALPDGSYKIKAILEDKTIYGNPLIAEDTDTFIIRTPKPTIDIDKSINPNSIVVNKKLPDSELLWVIKDSKENIVTEGTGNYPTIPTEEGSYIIEVTETSTEDLSAVTTEAFEIIKDDSNLSGSNNTNTNNNDDNDSADNNDLPKTGAESILGFISILSIGVGLLIYLIRRNKQVELSDR